MNLIAVIILNWNTAEGLHEFLPQVIKATDPAEADVIVADNGSTDHSRQVLQQEFPEVKTLLFDQNYGFAGGYNRALRWAAEQGYEYAVLLNSDVAPARHWLRPMLDYMEAHRQCGACQPKILSYSHPEMLEYAGAAGGYIDRWGYPYCRGRLFDTVEADTGQYDDIVDVDWATGAALMVRTDVYERAGRLDEGFFAHMEEIDLCWRIRLMGYTVAVVPESRVRHLGGGSLAMGSPRKTYLNFRNNLLLLHKNLPSPRRARVLLVRRLLDAVAWGRFALTGQWAQCAAIWKAHRHFARMRRQYPRNNYIPDLLSRHPSILWQYYIKGRRHFSQLPQKGSSRP